MTTDRFSADQGAAWLDLKPADLGVPELLDYLDVTELDYSRKLRTVQLDQDTELIVDGLALIRARLSDPSMPAPSEFYALERAYLNALRELLGNLAVDQLCRP